jgi:hypothetical protein
MPDLEDGHFLCVVVDLIHNSIIALPETKLVLAGQLFASSRPRVVSQQSDSCHYSQPVTPWNSL